MSKGLFTPWTMKLSLGHVKKICGWFVELIPGPCQFTPSKRCQSDHGVRGLQKTYFKAFIIH